jgi:hypothetical protein
LAKRHVRILVLMGAVAAGVVTDGTPVGAQPRSTGAAGASVAVGTSFVVEPPMAHFIAELDAREQLEQVRDWAVLATVTRLGATPESAAAATYELPPARLPYLDELSKVPRGSTSRRMVYSTLRNRRTAGSCSAAAMAATRR